MISTHLFLFSVSSTRSRLFLDVLEGCVTDRKLLAKKYHCPTVKINQEEVTKVEVVKDLSLHGINGWKI